MKERLNVFPEEVSIVFYDGSCGLCHYFVRFTLTRMKKPFLFSPLQGKTFSELVKTKKIEHIPDSIAVYDKKQDRIYFKTEAVLCVLRSLGRGWKCLAGVISCIPICIADVGYDLIAKIRSKVFKTPKDICPILSQDLKKFFQE